MDENVRISVKELYFEDEKWINVACDRPYSHYIRLGENATT
jgi:hypothetical protein